MMNSLFTNHEGNLLIRILIAHIVSDFVLQNQWMVDNKNKNPLSIAMATHIAITFLSVFIFSGDWIFAGIIAIAHFGVDYLKVITRDKLKEVNETYLFFADQLLHVVVILGVWASFIVTWSKILEAPAKLLNDYRSMLIILGYALVIWPLRFCISFIVKAILKTNTITETSLQHGGKWIGIFERIIILTFVLMRQYDAIGFLITGKSIIRFATQEKEQMQSEYVLAGTMMSYAFAILTGVIINWLLAFQ